MLLSPVLTANTRIQPNVQREACSTTKTVFIRPASCSAAEQLKASANASKNDSAPRPQAQRVVLTRLFCATPRLT